jgi:hypothetical protein
MMKVTAMAQSATHARSGRSFNSMSAGLPPPLSGAPDTGAEDAVERKHEREPEVIGVVALHVSALTVEIA